MELLNQLEENINATLESYELLQLEAEELKEEIHRLEEENTSLAEKQTHWESKVKTLLSVFSDTQSISEEGLEEDIEEAEAS